MVLMSLLRKSNYFKQKPSKLKSKLNMLNIDDSDKEDIDSRI